MQRLKYTVGILLLVFAVMFGYNSAGVFYNVVLGDGVQNLNELTSAELKNQQPLEGEVTEIYECLGSEVTTDGNTGSETLTAYYYVIPFADDEYMLLKTHANTELDDDVTELYYEETEKVALSGVTEGNEEELVSYFNEWCEEEGIKDAKLAPYTLNAENDVDNRVKQFYIALALLAAFIVYVIICVAVSKKKRRANA